tara:strand:+ start:236 stop:1222 length:987 start_codon:yes stop_codon:yes gene_type:complete
VGLIKTTFTLLGLAAGSYVGVSSAMAAKLTQVNRIPHEVNPKTVKLDFRNVIFTSRGGGTELSGWLIAPPCNQLEPLPITRDTSWVIMVNGDDASRSDSKTGTLGIARELHRHGFGIFMCDLRGRGDSPSTMSSSGLFEQLDVLGASDYLVSNGANRTKIGILGFSLGGSVALLAGSKHNSFGAVVSDSAFADLEMLIKTSMTGVKRIMRVCLPGMKFMAQLLHEIDIREISPARAIARTDTPVLIIHGEEDPKVPVEHARLLGRAIGASFDEIELGKESIWIVPRAGHTGAFRTEPDTYIEKLVRFYEEHLVASRNHNSSNYNSNDR